MTIANYLTFLRIILSPFFLFIYLSPKTLGIEAYALPYALLTIIIISELSDAFDGFLARKYNQVTDLGKILDPMADSIARTSVFLTFTLEPVSLPMPIIFVFLYRDSLISTLRTICALRGYALAARTSGKAKAIIQATVSFLILFLMIPHSLGHISTETLHEASTYAVSLAALYTVASGFDYIYAHWFYIKKSLALNKNTNLQQPS